MSRGLRLLQLSVQVANGGQGASVSVALPVVELPNNLRPFVLCDLVRHACHDLCLGFRIAAPH